MKYLILLFAVVIIPTLKAEGWENVSARSSAVGGAGAAFDRGVFGSYYNPAASARSWEDLSTMEFSMSVGGRLSMHGQTHKALLKIKHKQEDLQEVYRGLTFNYQNPMASATYLADALKLLDDWEDVDAKRGDGITASFRADLGVVWRNVFLPRDQISLHLSHTQDYAAWLEIDRSNFNFGLKLFEMDAWDFDWVLSQLYQYLGPIFPQTPEGLTFSEELVRMGYDLEYATMIARIVEDAGYKFTGELSHKMLSSLLYNSLYGIGESLESGANPVEGNDSKYLLRGIVQNEIAVGYSMAIPGCDWLTAGATFKLIQAQRIHFGALVNPGLSDFFGNPIDARYNLGLDLGLTATISKDFGFSAGVSIKDVNAPSFKWRDYTFRRDPQVRLSSSVYPFSTQVPFSLGFDIDLNRVETLLDKHYSQNLCIGFEIAPNIEPITFAIRLGFTKNIGDSGEPWLFTGGLGFTLWGFTIDLAGQGSIETIYGSQEILGLTLPTSFELGLQLSYKIKF